ncbi:MAG: dTMP kinase [Rhodospirillales bacterium]|nr:dTMP kinase [Rhodospirillales bacterium]
MSLQRGSKPLGNFITLEGGEGAGKTTQIKLLADGLKTAGIDTVTTREPGGAPAAEVIRSLLVEGDVERWQPMTEALLNYAARLEHVRETIEPALTDGRWVISDRFSDSTVAYQGFGHDLGRAKIERLHELVLGSFEPDLTFVLDLPVDEGLARAENRDGEKGAKEDRYERMSQDFHQRLRDGFLDIARRNPERCAVIDATQSPDDVQKEIRSLINNRLGVSLT